MGEGWRSGAAGLPVYPALARLLDAGTTWIAVTSIAQDGTMDGPDIALPKAVRRLAPDVRLLGFGGVRSTSDVRTLRNLGCDGAILGRSVYEGALTIAIARAALDAMGGDPV